MNVGGRYWGWKRERDDSCYEQREAASCKIGGMSEATHLE